MYYTEEEFEEIYKSLSEEVTLTELVELFKTSKNTASKRLVSELEFIRNTKPHTFSRKSVQELLLKNYLFLVKNNFYLSLDEIEDCFDKLSLKYDRSELREKISNRLYSPTANNVYKLPFVDVDDYYLERKRKLEEYHQLSTNKELDYLSVYYSSEYVPYAEVMDFLNCNSKELQLLIERKILINSVSFSKYTGNIFIHKSDLPLINSFLIDNPNYFNENKNVKIRERNNAAYSKKVKTYEEEIVSFRKVNGQNFKITIDLLEEYLKYIQNNSNNFRVEGECRSIFKTVINTIDKCNKDLNLLTNEEVETIVAGEIPVSHKLKLISFLKFMLSKVDSSFNNVPKIIKKRQTKNAKIYSKEEFFEMYRLLLDFNRHKAQSLLDFRYAQRWFFLTVAFSNAWRFTDIVKFPSPEIPVVDGSKVDLEWFDKNELNEEESLKLLRKVQNEWTLIINKTGLLNELIVPRDMAKSMANSLIIVELYRIKYKDTVLLRIFENGSTHTDGFNKFFKDKHEFRLSMVTKSLLTYSFLKANEIGKYAAVSNSIVSRMRGHKSKDTIFHYIGNNLEGNEALMHLNRRGHFGFLYSLLIDVSLYGTELTTEEKTKLIESVIEIFSPIELESLGGYFSNRKEYMKTIGDQVFELTKEEASNKLVEIHNGNMPSFELEAQCFVSGNCIKSNRDCQSCPYLVPKIQYLTSVREDLVNNIKELRVLSKENTYKRIKLTTIVGNQLSLINSAAVSFGRDYVNEYIDLKELHLLLESCKHNYLEVK